jgi:uncharacterized protein YdeI (YjbR/CyaY-like superfamily)
LLKEGCRAFFRIFSFQKVFDQAIKTRRQAMIPQKTYLPLVFLQKETWSDWLREHSCVETEAWLQIKRIHSPEPGITLAEAVTEAIRFGWIDGKMHSAGEDFFHLRFAPRKTGSLWSKINRQRAEVLISEGKMTESGMKTVQEAIENGRWKNAYTSRVKPEISLDLQTALNGDPFARQAFDDWSNSRQLQYSVWIGQTKRPATRQKRIQEVLNQIRADHPIPQMRPHHGLCFQFFAGKGYSEAFVANMAKTIAWLENHPDETLILESKPDIICHDCPHKRGNRCLTQKKVAGIDRRTLDLCRLENGCQTTWNAYKNIVLDHIILAGRLLEACGDCEWFPSCFESADIIRKKRKSFR